MQSLVSGARTTRATSWVHRVPARLLRGGLIFVLLSQACIAQGSAGSEGKIEPRYLVDIPTAGLLDRGSFSLDVNFFQSGGVLLGLSAGVLDRLNFGVSYGGMNIIGAEEPKWNKLPGVAVRFRLLDEAEMIPAVAIGFDSQGKEAYIDSLERYTIKSPGFYVAGSKNFNFLGYFSIHGGFNLSLERADGDTDPNAFLGVEKSVGDDISIMLEHNFGFNDSNREALGRGRGYLNFGFRWSFGSGFTFGFDLKDIIKNQQKISIGKRAISLEYVKFF